MGTNIVEVKLKGQDEFGQPLDPSLSKVDFTIQQERFPTPQRPPLSKSNAEMKKLKAQLAQATQDLKSLQVQKKSVKPKLLKREVSQTRETESALGTDILSDSDDKLEVKAITRKEKDRKSNSETREKNKNEKSKVKRSSPRKSKSKTLKEKPDHTKENGADSEVTKAKLLKSPSPEAVIGWDVDITEDLKFAEDDFNTLLPNQEVIVEAEGFTVEPEVMSAVLTEMEDVAGIKAPPFSFEKKKDSEPAMYVLKPSNERFLTLVRRGKAVTYEGSDDDDLDNDEEDKANKSNTTAAYSFYVDKRRPSDGDLKDGRTRRSSR